MFWKEREQHSLVAAGRVNCLIRGADVDIEECLTCAELSRVVDDDPPYVVCAARRDRPPAAEMPL